ncbi:pq loop repeat family protein [Ichthyophthirius multifiliis]|uniref:Mannose-P-dolichol utilization defect 1 protein homolog n=1 Tax=Ichthyophthirius multifiliis TaxID=5932 RepID=G0QSS6_ICHMU|nr:pq loop repeat family protein [Ichthyophthirius multifiliis]EGR31734.1 pq loop repeat family protein [Ichthyophthirius multifiliis]|eukprot:XP_004035220.1 pq loop repeat family protein [Ichthyophthirius multifiliis]
MQQQHSYYYFLLQIIKQNKKYKYLVFTEQCYNTYFVNHQLTNPECFKLTLSKTLGIAIVTLSTILKVPQIIKIIQNKSVQGLSYSSLIFECLLYLFTISYNLYIQSPFSLYGENIFIIFQNIIIMCLFNVYDKKFSLFKLITTFIFIGGISAPLLLQIVPKQAFDLSIIINMIMCKQIINRKYIFYKKKVSCSRLPQMIKNFKDKSTGQLALATFFLNFSGAIARTFTIFTESPNMLILISNFQAVILNGIIFLQILLIGNRQNKKIKTN